MNRAQIAALLGLAAARDYRKVGETDVLAWHEDLHDLDFDDAREAVSRHYRESTERLMPAHVRRIVAQIARERRQAEREQRERLAIETEAASRGPVTDRSADVGAFVAQVRQVLPEGDPDALRYGHRYWREEQRAAQRAAEAEPNPYFDPALAGPVAEWSRTRAESVGCWWADEKARERHAIEELAKAGRLRPPSQRDDAPHIESSPEPEGDPYP